MKLKSLFFILALFFLNIENSSASYLLDKIFENPYGNLSLFENEGDLKNARDAYEKWGKEDEEYEINPCSYAHFSATDPHIAITAMQEVAYNRVDMKLRRKERGYPEYVDEYIESFIKTWAEFISRSARENSDVLGSGAPPEVRAAANKLADQLNQITDENLPSAYVKEFCGADETPLVKVKTNPEGGAVQVLTVFAFDVCVKKLNKSGLDQGCGWIDVPTGSVVVQGTYMYRIAWPGEPEYCGKADFVSDNNLDGEQGTIVLTNTQRSCL